MKSEVSSTGSYRQFPVRPITLGALAVIIEHISRQGRRGLVFLGGLLLCLALSCRSVQGEGMDAKAVIQLLDQAQKGDAAAKVKLGTSFLLGQNGSVAEWLRKMAAEGQPIAELDLGYLYDNGYGLEQDSKQAFQWYLKAAEKGNTLAERYVAGFYWEGKVVKQDKSEAAKWYQRSADQGDSFAEMRLGLSYAKGWGVEKDDVKSFSYYFLSAIDKEEVTLEWVAYAQQCVATDYYQGIGVRKDLVEAYKWALISGSKWKNENAGNLIRALQQEMSRAQIEEAERKVGAYWRARSLGMTFDSAVPWGSFSKGSASERIPIGLWLGGMVVLPVELNGQRFNMAVDTGATSTCLDEEIAGKLPLANIPAIPTSGFGPKTQKSRITSGQELIISGLTIAPVQLWLTPLKSVISASDKPFHGLLGMDVISRFVIEIDYEAQTIQFFDPVSYHYEGKAKPIPVSYKKWSPSIPIKLTLAQGDPIEFACPIDTGAVDVTLALGGRFIVNHDVFSRVGKMVPQGAIGIGGMYEYALTRVVSVEIGGQVIESPLVELNTGETGLLSDSEAGLIGAGLFRRFRVTLDLPHDRIYLEPNSHVNELGKYNLSGLVPKPSETNPGEYVIARVFLNTPASEAGLQAGDVLLEVDGKKFGPHVENDGHPRASETPGDHELLIRRGDQELRIKVKFRELL